MERSRTTSRLGAIVLLLYAAAGSGCAYLRIPRIDPTGERIFAEGPIVAAPRFQQVPGGQLRSDPVAVTLSPEVTVAPLGSEVVLVAGVSGPDNCLRTNRRLEWSISSGSVGHFVSVGRNGLTDWLVGDFNRPRKIDNTFAVGSTSRRSLRLTRGTPVATDDVYVLPGQGWISVSSPVEGTSHVSVYAPEVYGWDLHTRSSTIHWVDAEWSFPPPAINPAGSRHVFTTTVLRHTDNCPCVGWIVRYAIVDGPAAGFAPDGAQSIEVETDAAGRAAAEIFQQEPASGTNRIDISVIRPPGAGDSNCKLMAVGSGSTLATWSAPKIAVRTIGPPAAAVGATLAYTIEVTNPGDMPADDVTVTDQLPAELEYVDSDPPASVSGNRLQWQLGQLGSGACRAIRLNCRAAGQGSITNCADVAAAGGLSASHCAVTAVGAAAAVAPAAAPKIDLKISGPTEAKVGQIVTFEIVVANIGQTPTPTVLLKDRLDPGLQHAIGRPIIEAEIDSLAPGNSRRIGVTLRVVKPGKLCNRVEIVGADGILARAEACVNATGEAGPQAEPTLPELLSVTKTGPTQRMVGETARFAIKITNNGSKTLRNLKVVDRYDAGLFPKQASEGHKPEGNDLVWKIDSLAAGQTIPLDVHCNCIEPAARACNRVKVTAEGSAPAEAEACLSIGAAPSGLKMTVTDLTDPVRRGKGLTYEVLVSNESDVPAANVAVEVTVPQGLLPDRIGTSGPTASTIIGSTVRFEPVAEIRKADARLSFHVRVQTIQAGKHTLRVKLSADNLSPPIVVEEVTEVF